ncbi:MAG: peptidoglycan DD-metalloendopeptidase family protein [Clostridia bacterium]|nr:peptidoglycan DD-metalloendopeptidase family protein [Clostridia bacterium]
MTFIAMSCAGAVMILLIALLRRMLLNRLPKRFFRLIWLAVVVRLLLPLSLTVEIPVFAESLPLAQTVTAGAQTSEPSSTADNPPSAQADWKIGTDDILAGVWLAGFMLTMGYFLVGYGRFCARIRAVDCTDERILGMLGRQVSLRLSDAVDTPLTYGVLRPVILLPSAMTAEEDDRLRCILDHEQTHIAHHDAAYKWLLTVTACLHWFNPTVWLMLHFAGRDMELACDEAVLATTDRARYARCLLAAEERLSKPITDTIRCSGFGSPLLTERIMCIMKARKITIVSIAAAVSITAAMSAFFVSAKAVPVDEPVLPVSWQEDDSTETTWVSKERIIEPETTAETVTAIGTEAVSDEIALSLPLDKVDRVSSEYGFTFHPIRGTSDFHNGIDLVRPADTDILASAAGEVVTAEYDRSFGNYIIIDHGDGVKTLYAHCSKLLVEAGDKVEAGDIIAKVGSTGSATGAHLHFSVYVNDSPVDPRSYITF